MTYIIVAFHGEIWFQHLHYCSNILYNYMMFSQNVRCLEGYYLIKIWWFQSPTILQYSGEGKIFSIVEKQCDVATVKCFNLLTNVGKLRHHCALADAGRQQLTWFQLAPISGESRRTHVQFTSLDAQTCIVFKLIRYDVI